MLYNEYRLHKKNEETMNNISDLLITEPVTEPSTTAPPTTSGTDTTKAEATTTTRPTTTQYLTPSEQLELLKKQNPDINFPVNLQPKYAKLYLENQDFVGYLSADGVKLNLPVVQTDNDEVYLNKNFYGTKTKYGCPFVTHLNNMSYNHLDMNTVIFGHHMNNGTIFGALDKYKTLTGYKSAPVISFNTIYRDYQWRQPAGVSSYGLGDGKGLGGL
jgi:SrtB family sortase